MATTELYIDLTKEQPWITDDARDGTISGSFEQKPDNVPKIGWSLNTIQSSAGLKSLTPYFDDSQVANLSTLSNADSFYNLAPIIGTNGNLTYGSFNLTRLDAVSTVIEIFDDTNWIPVIRSSSAPQFFHRKHTTFQNQTLFALDSGDSIDVGVTQQGDALSGSDLAIYNPVLNTITITNLVNLSMSPPERKLGMTSFQNYVIFWGQARIFWSSPTNFADFTPALGGGGETKISEAKGAIITVVPHPTGLMVYCKRNIVHMSFSGETANPWIFTEIADSNGVLIYKDLPLVTFNESSATQVALTTAGLELISPNGAIPVPQEIADRFNNNAVELKPVGDCDITTRDFPLDLTGKVSTTLIYKIDIIGNDIFIYVGRNFDINVASEFNDSRLYVYNITTRHLSILEGTYLAVTPVINFEKDIAASGPDLFLKPDEFAKRFYAVKRSTTSTLGVKAVVLDFARDTDRPTQDLGLGYVARDAEFQVGPISITRTRNTVIHRIRLDGRLTANSDTMGTDRCRVFVYSKSTLGATNPIEFIFNPLDESYYGYIEGKDLLLEVRGKNFYLTGIEVEVERGGKF